jgi:hypothetical protein
MLFKFAAILFLAALALAGMSESDDASKTLPKVPKDLVMGLEANILQLKSSFRMKWYHDYTNNRIRLEFFKKNTYHDVVFNFDEDKLLHVKNHTHCDVKKLSKLPKKVLDWLAPGGHIRKTEEILFPFKGLKYVDSKPAVRGIPVDHFKVHYEGKSPRDDDEGHKELMAELGLEEDIQNDLEDSRVVKLNVTLHWYFASKGWCMRHSNWKNDPLRAHVKGDVMLANKKVMHIEHYLEIADLVAGQAPMQDWLFHPWHCKARSVEE